METVISVLSSTYETTSATVAEYAPRVLATSVVLVTGLLATRAAKSGVLAILDALKLEELSKRVGVSDALKRADVKLTMSQIVAALVYWTLLVFTAAVSLNTLGIANGEMFSRLGAMVPNVIVAATILVLGLNLSNFISTLIQTAAVNAEIRQARIVRNAAHYGMGTLVVAFALRQLGVPEDLLNTGCLILFSSVCAALALSFGLGGRDLAANIAKSTWKHEREQTQALAEAANLGNQLIPSTPKSPKATSGRTVAA